MKFHEKEEIVISSGLSPEDTEVWFQKYTTHLQRSRFRGLDSELNFSQYIEKAIQANLYSPSMIGSFRGQFVLARIGDIGHYTEGNCRFIPTEENVREAYGNGRHVGGIEHRAAANRGQTKETSDRYRKISDSRKGRSKETHPEYLPVSEAHAKNFVLVAPDGSRYEGTNLQEFCRLNNLNTFGMYNVMAGRRRHHRGWTGHYAG